MPTSPVKQRSVTILVVEDDIDILLGIEEIINSNTFIVEDTQYNITVLTAKDGQAGLEKLRAHKPDLIISDVMMPRISGLQFLESIQAHPEWIHIPFIFLTARNSKPDRQAGIIKGASLYLTKPFEVTALVQHIRSQLKRSFALQDAQEQHVASFKRQILKILNHEFRTPLTYVTAYYEMLAYKATSPERLADYQDYLRGIQLGCIRLSKIIEDFALVLDLNSGQLKESFKDDAEIVTNLPHLIQNAASWTEENMGGENVEMIVDIPEHLPAIIGCPRHINNILVRILDNAIKFSVGNDRPSRVEMTAYADSHEVVIKIKDNGLGMPPYVIDKIFDLFYQFNRSAKEQQGTGTGLSIAAGLVELHQGYIEVESVDTVGSEFRVVFPQNDQIPSGVLGDSGKKRVTVLAVEDDPYLLDGLQDLLETVESKYELEVLTAVNGQEALHILENRLPDLIISDIMMPKMSGYDLLQAVRSRPEWLHIRFIFLTARGKSPDKHKAYIMGVDEYITKPYESDLLLDIINAQLDRRFLIQKMLNRNFDALKNSIINLITPSFHQPLSFVNQYVDRLTDSLNDIQTMDEFKESLEGIQTGSEWLQRLVEDFMILAEFKTGEAKIAFQLQAQQIPNISVVLAEFAQMYTIKQADENVQLVFDAYETQLAPIRGDISQISECVGRLIGIGRTYRQHPNEPLLVKLSTQQSQTHIFIDLNFDDSLSGNVSNGIRQILQDSDESYELFRSLDFASELNIVRGYIALHDGFIHLETSEPDRFNFRIGIPISS